MRIHFIQGPQVEINGLGHDLMNNYSTLHIREEVEDRIIFWNPNEYEYTKI